MLLRDPFFKNDLESQPYYSLLIITPNCDFTCSGCCQNKELMNYETIDFSFEELANKYFSDWYQGITVAGLEITCSPEGWAEELLAFVKLYEIKKLTIYTREEKTHPLIKKIIDNYEGDLYLKTGRYIPNLPSYIATLPEDSSFDLPLISNNQLFFKVK